MIVQVNTSLNLLACNSSIEFIENVKKLNQCDWPANHITVEVIKNFLEQNEIHFQQVLMDAGEMKAVSTLVTRIKTELGTTKETEELFARISRATTLTFHHLPLELKRLVFECIVSSPLNFRKATKLQRTSKQWYKMVRAAQANYINHRRMPLRALNFSLGRFNQLRQFLATMNKEQPNEPFSWITCLNLKNFYQNQIAPNQSKINSVMKRCPNLNTLVLGSNESCWLENCSFFRNPTENQIKKIKLFHFEIPDFSFKLLQQLSRLCVLYPEAQFRLGSKGRFCHPLDIRNIASELKEDEYVISPCKGSPGIYEVQYRIDEVTYQMSIDPANDPNDRAFIVIEKMMNAKKWQSHPEVSLGSLHLTHTELLSFLRRQPVANHTLNFSDLEGVFADWVMTMGGHYWDSYLRDVLQCSSSQLQTLLADSPRWLLTCSENLALVLKESGCRKLTTLKFESQNKKNPKVDELNEDCCWYPYHFIQLSKIKTEFPLIKIELPHNGHFAMHMGEAKQLLSSPNLPDKSYAVWPSRSVPGAYGLLFIHKGKLIEMPYMINDSAQISNTNQTIFNPKNLLAEIFKAFEHENGKSASAEQRDPNRINQPVSR